MFLKCSRLSLLLAAVDHFASPSLPLPACRTLQFIRAMVDPVATADPACSATHFFQELSAAGTDVLSSICGLLERDEWGALHVVNRAMRRAMNATVTRVTLGDETHPTLDLLEVFPNASALDLHLASATELLEQLASGNARLLARLHHLRFTICSEEIEHIIGAIIPALLQVLSR